MSVCVCAYLCVPNDLANQLTHMVLVYTVASCWSMDYFFGVYYHPPNRDHKRKKLSSQNNFFILAFFKTKLKMWGRG